MSANRHSEPPTAVAGSDGITPGSGVQRRLSDQAVLRGQSTSIVLDGDPLDTFVGETVAAAMIAAHQRVLRKTSDGGMRGLYCGIGVCFECLVTIDGIPNRRACMTPVAAGMLVTRQVGWSDDVTG